MNDTPDDVHSTFYQVRSPNAPKHKHTILVVDDTSTSLKLLAQLLTRADYKVRTAGDGKQALASVQANPPDLILLDVMMPGIDGYEVCRRLKANESTRNIPIVFISARGDTEAKIQAFNVGGVDYIPKPFQPKEILARVRTHISLQELQQNLREQIAKHKNLIQKLDLANTQLQQEITERQKFEQALVESKEHFRTVADFTYNWEYWIGPEGHIIYMSPACHRITGYRPEEFQKQPTLIVTNTHPEDRKAWIQHLNSILTDKDICSMRLRIITRDGETRWIGHTCQPVYSSKGDFLGRRASNRDITEQVQAEQQVGQYTADLQARNEELDAFAHTVAHDLKNPLAALVGFSYLLEKRAGKMSPKDEVEMARIVGKNARKMSNIIDELLLLASVRKMTEVPLDPIDMEAVVKDARGRLETLIEEANAHIVTPTTWPIIPSYAPWIEEVWVNYISNAVKYGGQNDDKAPPYIELGYDTFALSPDTRETTAPPPHTSQIRFWAKDNGPGLPPEAGERLFTQFTRLHDATIEGHGLGLSIVKRIIQKLGGHVGVDSTLGQGSTFWFSLPAHNNPTD